MAELPWSRREIIDAVIAEYRPIDMKDPSSFAILVCIAAFMRLALGRPEGRASPYVEQALHNQIKRVYAALRDGRDPNAAYDVPIEGEETLTYEEQLKALSSPLGRKFAAMLDDLDRDLRARRSR
jgi:hypothetical protein